MARTLPHSRGIHQRPPPGFHTQREQETLKAQRPEEITLLMDFSPGAELPDFNLSPAGKQAHLKVMPHRNIARSAVQGQLKNGTRARKDTRGHWVHAPLPAYLLRGPGLPCGPSQGRHPPQTQPWKRAHRGRHGDPSPQAPLPVHVSAPEPQVATWPPGAAATLAPRVRGHSPPHLLLGR